MKRKLSKLAAVCILGTMLNGGCSIEGLLKNMWAGFGYSLGGLPAQYLIDLINPPADAG